MYFNKVADLCSIPDFSKELYDFNRDGPKCINYFLYNGNFYICFKRLPSDDTTSGVEKCIADLFKMTFDSGITKLDVDVESFEEDWNNIETLLNRYKNYYPSITVRKVSSTAK